MLSNSIKIILEKYSIKDCHQKVKGILQDQDVIIIMVEMLIRVEKKNVSDFITAFSDYLSQASNVQISI